MQTVVRCQTIQAAHRVRLFLDSIGINSLIPNETEAIMLPNQFFHGSEVRVEVNEEDFSEASEALKKFTEETAIETAGE